MHNDSIILKNIACKHFKNHTTHTIHFSDQVNFIIGNNGAGKTNLLDAIHYLTLTKSACNAIDNQNIQHGKNEFILEGDFYKEGRLYTIQCTLQQGNGKVLKKNNKVYERLYDHIGLLPIVIAFPHDIDIIHGGSELRRKFFDSLICQLNKAYLHYLITYNRTLAQRNSLLRWYGTYKVLDKDLLHIYDQHLIELNHTIADVRDAFLTKFYPYFVQYYQYLTSDQELVHIDYKTQVTRSGFVQDFSNNISQDLLVQRTTMGIHRDDFLFTINNYPLKKLGSQGQQKSFIITLRLAQFAYMQQALQLKPLLLLDDIFDKLDEQRIDRIIQLVTEQNFGQLFITETGIERGTTLWKKTIQHKQLLIMKEGYVITKMT